MHILGILAIAPLVGAGLISAGGSILGGLLGGSGARSGAKMQAKAMNRATALQRDMWEQQQADIAPWLQAGMAALPQLKQMAGQPMVGQFDVTQTPGYQFRLDEGQKSVVNSLAARGLSASGAAMKGLERYGQDYASGEYGAEYNRRLAESQGQWNRYAGLAGIGQTAQQDLSNLGGQYASNVGNALINQGGVAGGARASAYNNWGNIASGIGNQGADLIMMNWAKNQGLLGGTGYQQTPQTNYLNPFWSQQNPLGLTPGQGL